VERVLTQVQVRRIEARLALLWPPGPQALGAAAARVVEAMITSARRAPGVLTVFGGEFGVRNRVGVLPCLLGPGGITEVRPPALNARERVQLETALGA
jgi:malate/lactate dehydrogenase